MTRDYILGQEKEFKALMKLSIPATIAMLVNAIYNIVDTIFIGRGVGSLGIAGVSIYLPIQMVIMSVSLLIGVGTASIVSRKLGSKDLEGANKASGNLFFIIGLFSFFVSVFGFIFANSIVKLFGASHTVLPYAASYAKTMFLGVLVFPICVASNNIIRAEGNAKDAMNSMIIGMIANVFLDYLFIYVFDMGITGAGLATSISKGLNFAYISYYFIKKSSIDINFKYFKFDSNISKQTIAIGSSAFITQISMSIVTLLLNYSLYNYGGDQAISVYGIVYKLTLFIQMPLAGLIQGMQPLIGYNLGSKNIDRIKNTVKINLIVSTCISTVLTALIFLFPELIINLFSTDKNLISQGSDVLKIVIFMYPILGLYMVAVGFYQSIGKGKESLILSLLRQIIFFIPLSIILPSVSNLGILGIWISFPISDLLSSLCSLVFAIRQYKKIYLSPKNQLC
ncbi:MATE family efflux transporter [Tepidibacter hydrothermalis]|uniref:Multidrug export protein MepA n=1 Tax=Tepidibacter hydrothermalis TaxID=3036126 RepID=A0ABY8EJP2_9FIRM|nr:MATE family efflux transporter [Tepidibacter hydrothermalis]WFD11295.1 MATE family efflux transporter [Tepidibacter hydrothermalis]